ncbi:hypothetical protein B296_00036843 [Ensete ventricosum]|uniref:Uncharacterized protein n=1 Tax=Ensete ventricosum TaxID=4639 RepID=A0A426ZWX7_ENSVE|nr:hypothetical protein B296_00036843 [Ensete ventricosum]
MTLLTQIVTYYKHDQLSEVLNACERMHAHLTAAVVSNDPLFLQVSLQLSKIVVSHFVEEGYRCKANLLSLAQLVIPEVQELAPQKQSNLFGLATERLYTISGPCHRIGESHHLHKVAD